MKLIFCKSRIIMLCCSPSATYCFTLISRYLLLAILWKLFFPRIRFSIPVTPVLTALPYQVDSEFPLFD